MFYRDYFFIRKTKQPDDFLVPNPLYLSLSLYPSPYPYSFLSIYHTLIFGLKILLFLYRNFCFVRYEDQASVTRALKILNGRQILPDHPVRIEM